jgi:Protein of unknown function (DUF2505)
MVAMSRSFEVVTDTPASVEQIHAAYCQEGYWQARIAAGSAAATTLDTLIIDPDGSVTVRVTQHVGRQLLKGPLAKLLPGDVKLVHNETWKPDGDGGVCGRISVSAGVLGSGHADNWLAPADKGSRLRSAGKVEVKIPLVGGKLEKFIKGGLAESISEIMLFTTTWIDENG